MKILLASVMTFISEDLRPLVQETRDYLKARRMSLDTPIVVEEELYRDAKYAEDRIGVSERTVMRLTAKGILPIALYVNRKRQFRDSDVERCRRYYRGGK